jgi:hypothetical protein
MAHALSRVYVGSQAGRLVRRPGGTEKAVQSGAGKRYNAIEGTIPKAATRVWWVTGENTKDLHQPVLRAGLRTFVAGSLPGVAAMAPGHAEVITPLLVNVFVNPGAVSGLTRGESSVWLENLTIQDCVVTYPSGFFSPSDFDPATGVLTNARTLPPEEMPEREAPSMWVPPLDSVDLL